MKAHQTKRKRVAVSTNKLSSILPSKDQCNHDIPNMIRLCKLEDHAKVRKCYHCSQSIFTANPESVAIATKTYRTYREKGTRLEKVSLKLQWTYFYMACFSLDAECKHKMKKLHVCPGKDYSPEVYQQLAKEGYTLE